jgi:hypothetical protein
MEIGFIFWLIMLLSLLFWGMWGWGGLPAFATRGPIVHGFLLFVLLFLLGWKVFGFAIHA